MKNRKTIGIVAMVVGIVASIFLVGFVVFNNINTVSVYTTATATNKGVQMTEDNIKVVKMKKSDVLEGYCTTKEGVVGKFAKIDMVANDIVTTEKIADTATATDNQFLSIPSGKQAISFSVAGGADSLSNKLLAGDIIRIFSYDAQATDKVQVPKPLQFVQVASVTSSQFKDVDEKSKAGENDENSSYATITCIVTTEQAEEIIRVQKEGGCYVSLISRGNEKVASQLLTQQEQILK